MEKNTLEFIELMLRRLAYKLEQFDLYLFGSLSRKEAVIKDIDILVEVDMELFETYNKILAEAKMELFCLGKIRDTNVAGTVLEILGLSWAELCNLVSPEIAIIIHPMFVPKDWREEKTRQWMKDKKIFTDPLFLEKIQPDLKRITEKGIIGF